MVYFKYQEMNNGYKAFQTFYIENLSKTLNKKPSKARKLSV